MDKAENIGGRALSYVQTVRWTAGNARRRHNVFRKLSSTPHSHADVRYRADITAGSLKVAESRRVAELLLEGVDDTAWKRAIVDDNILQARNPESAKRLARLIRARLEPLGPSCGGLCTTVKGRWRPTLCLLRPSNIAPCSATFSGWSLPNSTAFSRRR